MKFYLDELEEKLKEVGYKKAYINKCKEYASRLMNNNMPVFFDAQHLSLTIGVNKSKLYSLVYMGEIQQYHTICIPKKSGGVRTLTIPSQNLKILQRWILDNILQNMKVSDSAHGFIKKESIVTNAEVHIGKRYIVCIDMKDFFTSIKFDRVFRLFYYYGYTKEMSYIFARLCTYKGALPQGAPTSPYISNVVALKLDKRFLKLCEKIGASYSRYADDITISGNENILEYLSIYKKIIVSEGFTVNEKKFRISKECQQQKVTGLIVNKKMAVPRKLKNYLRQQIYFCKKYGVDEHLKHTGCLKANFKEHLYGIAYFIKMVEEEKGIQYLQELDTINWNEKNYGEFYGEIYTNS